jgi:hypothetical protein
VLRLRPRLEHELARSVDHARDGKLLLQRLRVGTLTDAAPLEARRARIARRVGSARAANVLSRVSVGICKDLLVNQIAGKIRHLKVGVNRCFRVPAITTTAAPNRPNVEAEYDEDGSPAPLSVEYGRHLCGLRLARRSGGHTAWTNQQGVGYYVAVPRAQIRETNSERSAATALSG